eukprot:scaffold22074_cov39-Cyclotella_meneghiniana.AAC.4
MKIPAAGSPILLNHLITTSENACYRIVPSHNGGPRLTCRQQNDHMQMLASTAKHSCLRRGNCIDYNVDSRGRRGDLKT